MDGNVDVIFVHAKEREEKFVAEWYGAKRYVVMHNDFVILGPAKDPAGIKGMKDAGDSLKRIADANALFISWRRQRNPYERTGPLETIGCSFKERNDNINEKRQKS